MTRSNKTDVIRKKSRQNVKW